MERRDFLKYSLLTMAATALPEYLLAEQGDSTKSRPNIVLFFTDDMGYSDLGVFGAKKIHTPHLDALAKSGTRFTDFYVSSPVCSASRAALLTGRYHSRAGIHGAIMPAQKERGLASREITLAESLKSNGYKTGMIGKWHLGHMPEFLPTRQGFDSYFGFPYSNDMSNDPKHSANPQKFDPLPLMRDEKVIELEPDQSQITERYTREAEAFIDQNTDQPFFLYFAHTMPHVPLFASKPFKDKSKAGLYGDVIEEIDASVGRVMKKLEDKGIAENTIVIFLSDNGPWLHFGNHGGNAKPLRGGKHSVFEGGIRVPCIMHWPSQIKAGNVISEPAISMDIMPTLLQASGTALPDKKFDGVNLMPYLKSPDKVDQIHEALFFYYGNNQLQAMRSDKWKLIFPHWMITPRKPENDGKRGESQKKKVRLSLYDLETDIGETRNLANEYPEVVTRLTKMADKIRSDMGDSLKKIKPRS